MKKKKKINNSGAQSDSPDGVKNKVLPWCLYPYIVITGSHVNSTCDSRQLCHLDFLSSLL